MLNFFYYYNLSLFIYKIKHLFYNIVKLELCFNKRQIVTKLVLTDLSIKILSMLKYM